MGVTTRHRSAISQQALLEVCHYFHAPENKGRAGMPGARCTRGPVCKSYQRKRTRAYRSTEITRHSRTQWLYGLYRALPGARARFVTVAGGMNSTGLMPASGIRTTRFFRTRRMLNVKSTFRVHHSPPRVCDDRETPLCLGRDGAKIKLIWRGGKRNFVKSESECLRPIDTTGKPVVRRYARRDGGLRLRLQPALRTWNRHCER